MRVLMVSRWFWEERERNKGVPELVGELAAAVRDAGVDLTVLSQDREAGIGPERYEIDGMPVWLFSRDKRLKRWSWADKLLKQWTGYRKSVTDAVTIRRFVREHGPFDLLWAQGEEPDGTTCALAVVGGGLPPLITQVHGLRHKIVKGRPMSTGRKLLGWAFARATRVISNSKHTAGLLIRDYAVPKEKIGFCRIHLTRSFLKGKAIAAEIKPEKRILFLGALNPKKAPDIFLRAAIEIAEKLPEWKFVLVGGETEKNDVWMSQLRELARHAAVAGRLEWKGRLMSEEVKNEVLRASFVVCPSYQETFSRTTMEGLAMGRPVIVTATSGAATWVAETGAGCVILPGSVMALARAMEKLVFVDSCKDQAAEAAGRVVAELTAEEAALDLNKEMNQVLAGTEVCN